MCGISIRNFGTDGLWCFYLIRFLSSLLERNTGRKRRRTEAKNGRGTKHAHTPVFSNLFKYHCYYSSSILGHDIRPVLLMQQCSDKME